MLDWMDIVNLIGVIAGLTIVLMGLFFAISVPILKRPDRSYIVIIFLILTAYISSDLISQFSLILGGSERMALSKAAIFFESFFSSLCMPFLTMYILTCAGKKILTDLYMILTAAMWLIYFFILCCTQFTDKIYYFTPDNVYHRGPLYPLLLTPPLILMLINLLCLFRNRDRLSKRQFQTFLIYIIIPIICMVIQMLWYGLLMVVLGSAVAAAFMLWSMIREHMDIYIRQRVEIADQRIGIMMLEMRPHFLYNTLTSIYYLCEQDSKKAQQVTKDFAAYLRMNFNAISKSDTIPFSEELEHTKAYLGVEMARFEDGLFVEYDFDQTPIFHIPPLTLQPIVENAIKHGLDPEYDALRIVISVKQTPAGNMITVEDNGQGINEISPDQISGAEKGPDTDRPHIALKNIRERLSLMCNGTLTISPREGGGTRVEIFIPSTE